MTDGTDVTFDFSDIELENGATYYYRVAAVGYNGLYSKPSESAALTPHAVVQSVVLAEPLTVQHTLSAVEPSPETQAVVFVPGITDDSGQAPGVLVQVGWRPADASADFTWTGGAYVADSQGGGDIYAARMLPETTGDYVYTWRASTTGGRDWVESDSEGRMTVYANADSDAPKPPFRLDEVSRSGSQVAIALRVCARTGSLWLSGLPRGFDRGRGRLRRTCRSAKAGQYLHRHRGYHWPYLCLHGAVCGQRVQRFGTVASAHAHGRTEHGRRHVACARPRGDAGRRPGFYCWRQPRRIWRTLQPESHADDICR